MTARPSKDDIEYKDRFESGAIAPAEFHHRDHLRLIYVYLCEGDVAEANDRMRASLKKFLKENDVPASKYHETLTYSWTQAVRHFMFHAGSPVSFDEFVALDGRLLDKDIMLSHYERETLFSESARGAFVPPDITPIPQYP